MWKGKVGGLSDSKSEEYEREESVGCRMLSRYSVAGCRSTESQQCDEGQKVARLSDAKSDANGRVGRLSGLRVGTVCRGPKSRRVVVTQKSVV